MTKFLAEAVVIGASAGAVEALSAVLPVLPADYPLPILIVVHLMAGGSNALPELLASRSAIYVKEAEDKEPISGSTVYLAPPDYHLLVEADRRVSLSVDEPVHFSRPAIDVLFETAAAVYRDKLVGVVMTGASRDGAEGLRAVQHSGGVAIVQRPETASAPEMPRAALEVCPAARTMGLEDLASFLSAGLIGS